MKTDVLVVGAGPVGLTLAAELARYGISVRIVEKAAQATDKSKALVLWSRTLELLDRMGGAGRFVDAGFRVTGARITAGGREIAHVTLKEVATPYPFALMLPQSDTERLLGEHLKSIGVTVERSVELTGFSTAEDTVTATLRHADGREEIVESAWLVGCDGAHSTVRHTLGLEFLGNTLSSDWILADVHLIGVASAREINVMWHSDGVLVIFPISENRFRVVADAGTAEDGAHRAEPTLAEVQAVLDRRGPGGITAGEPIWLAAFRINERKVVEYRSGRVFLAGDAAHIHSPAGGQGMNTGMQDAFNLAWKLALVTRHGCPPFSPLLDSYSFERSAVGDQVLKGAGRITTMATLKGGIKQAIRNHVATLVFGLGSVRNALADAISEVSIGYLDSPLSVHGAEVHDAPRAGQRAPVRPGEMPVGAGDRPRFVIFAEEERGDGAATRVRTKYADLLESGIRPPFAPGGLWLVRPDGYVAVATARGDWGRVADFLDNLTASVDSTSPIEYLVISRGQWDPSAAPADIQAAIDHFYEWLEQLVGEGKMRPGQRLKPEKRLVARKGILTDGPFVETKEVIGGYWFILAASMEEAAELAAQNPCLKYGLSYEIRPIEPGRASAFETSTETPSPAGS